MRYLKLLRRPIPLLLWLGQVTSTAGDRLYAMAMLWLALELTGSTTAMAAVSLFESIPLALAGLVAGVLVDRWDRLRTMIAVDVLRAFLAAAVPAAYLMGGLRPWHLMAVGAGMGVLGALFDPALEAALPGMVKPEEFPGFAGLMDMPSRFARLLGPGLAGVLLTLMPTVHFFSLDSATFVVSAVCLVLVAAMRRRAPGAPPQMAAGAGARRSWLHDVPAGWRIMRNDPYLPAMLASAVAGNLAWPVYPLGGMLLVTQKLGAGAGGYGLLIAAYGVGSLAGNVIAGNTDLGIRRSTLTVGGWLVIGLGFFLLGLAPSMTWAIAVTALAGVGGSIAHVSRAAYLGRAIPPEHLGKVSSLRQLSTTLAGAVGTLAVGALLEWVTAPVVISLGGLFMMIAGGVTLIAVLRPIPGRALSA